MRLLRYLYLLAIGGFIVSFSLANQSDVEVKLFPFSYSATMPLFVLLFLALLLGWICGSVLASMKSYRRFRRVRKIDHELRALKDEITLLRSSQLTTKQITR